MEPRQVTLELPRKLEFLISKCCPYKVAYGGRNSLKSHSFAGALLTLGIAQDLRILCAREVQKSLAQSVHQLLQDKIEALGYGDLYDVTDDAIRCRIKDTLFRFTGLSDHTAESIKSFEGFDVAWLEESQPVSKRSRQILFPTIFRTPGAEIWESFNPGLDSDDCWQRYVVNPPPGAVVVEMNYRDAIACGWWTNDQEALRQYSLIYEKADYDNIWEGKPRTSVAGAIYTTEITEMITEQRFRPMPYDPRLPVHRIWDLGWNDLMVVVMVQKPQPSVLNVVNYFEDKFIKYADVIAALKELRYNWGYDWLPHDSSQHHPTSGTNAKKQLIDLGCRVKDVPKSDPEARVRAARMMFPRVYLDNTKRDTPPERPDRVLGGGWLMERLKRYKRHIPKTTGEETGPVHDLASHGCFVGETKILTRYGTRRIMDLPESGEVLTPCGWRVYQNPRVTRINAPLVEVRFVDGTTVRCTPDHLFMTVSGWKSANALTRHSPVQSSLTRLPNILTDTSTNFIGARDIGQGAAADFIAIYGRRHLAQFLMAAISTIAITAHRIMTFQTWNVCQPASIYLPLGMSLTGAESTTKRVTSPLALEPLLRHGTLPLKDAYGIADMPRKRRDGDEGSAWRRFANGAARILWDSLKARSRTSSAVRPAKSLLIESVKDLRLTSSVWCLTVPEVGCFSLENGAIVHNCDAWGGLAEIVDRIRNDGDVPVTVLPGFNNVEPSMGMLG